MLGLLLLPRPVPGTFNPPQPLTISPPLLQQAAAAATSGQQHPAGALYVVATPIGNLADITLRAVHVLGLVDAVACEDTRVTGQLLRHLGLDKPLIALHQQNEVAAARGVVDAQHRARVTAHQHLRVLSALRVGRRRPRRVPPDRLATTRGKDHSPDRRSANPLSRRDSRSGRFGNRVSSHCMGYRVFITF